MTERITRVDDLILKSIFHYVGRAFGGYRLRAFERKILQSLIGSLPDQASERLRSQLTLMNHCSHWFGNQALEFGSFKGFSFRDVPLDFCLPLRIANTIPLVKAMVGLATKSQSDRMRVDLYIYQGVLLEMIFSERPAQAFGKNDPSPDEIEIEDIGILIDPLDLNPFHTMPESELDSSVAWLNGIGGTQTSEVVSAPLALPIRKRIEEFYDLPFPLDYLELMGLVGTIQIEDRVVIGGLSDIWTYITPTEYVHVLAELHGSGVLCLLRNYSDKWYKFEGQENELFYINNESHIPVPVGKSMRSAIEKYLMDGHDDWLGHESEVIKTLIRGRRETG